MSQMVTRKRTGGDEKEKRTDSPVKDMKKKMAANAEKEKNAAEKASDKSEKPTDKPADKPADKSIDKSAEKPTHKSADKAAERPADKSTDKPAEKASHKPVDKAAEKPKSSEKGPEKPTEKKDSPSEKKKEDGNKGESSGKPDRPASKGAHAKQNGSNGVNGTVSADSDSDELAPDEPDELFPELAYDDSDDAEPDAPQRSFTRRSQVKPTRTPETPPTVVARPLTADDSKDQKVLKLSQEPKNDSPKPETKKAETKSDAKKPETANAKESPKTDAKKGDREAKDADSKVAETPKKDGEASKNKEDKEKVEIEVVVEIESAEGAESRKPDTNFSKSRVKVSPYRRSMRLADQTMTSVTANYTGNNTTMEMDITESSSLLDASLDDSYLAGLRSIRARRSYKPLADWEPRPLSRGSLGASFTVSDQPPRPTGTVVGRKRKPEGGPARGPEGDPARGPEGGPARGPEEPPAGKRQRLLQRLARPFRPFQRAPADAQIVGINTDLPLSAPVAAAASFDPEALKPPPSPAPAPALGSGAPPSDDPKRCALM